MLRVMVFQHLLNDAHLHHLYNNYDYDDEAPVKKKKKSSVAVQRLDKNGTWVADRRIFFNYIFRHFELWYYNKELLEILKRLEKCRLMSSKPVRPP